MGTAHPRSVALTGARSRLSARRRVGHVLAGIAGWIGLGGLWAWQLSNYVPENWLTGVELIFALLLGWACFSVAWVAWCRSIYRRRHRRTKPIERDVDFSHDTLGRPIVAAPAVRTARGQVLVWVDASGIKHYQCVIQAPRERVLSTKAGTPATRRHSRLPA